MRLSSLILAVGAVGWACGCATYHPVPVQRLKQSETDVRTAKQVGAAEDPEAAVHLSLAQNQLREAKALIDDGENERAEWVLRRATMDAELAIAVARENWLRSDAQQVVLQVEAARHAHASR